MKKGSSKKILFGIVSAFFVLLALLAPNYKNAKVDAQGTCSVVQSTIENASTGDDSKASQDLYLKRPSTGLPIKIQVQVENCNGYSLSITLVEGGAMDDTVYFVDSLAKQKSKSGTLGHVPGWGPYTQITTDGTATIDFNFLAGESYCNNWSLYLPDCQYSFRVFAKKGAQTTYLPFNGDLLDDSRDNLYGNLTYEYDEENTDEWVYLSSTTSIGSTIQLPWFFKLTGGSWSKSTKTSLSECTAERDAATGSDKNIPCTQTPPRDELGDGALMGKPSIVPECDLNFIEGDTNVPACVTDIIYSVIFMPLSFLAGLAGQFFDLLFSFSISSEIYGGGGADIGFLKVAWTFIRDICNLGFILTLLWISILQILTPEKYNAKKQIPGIIAIALLINFSYFFGTIIIDATNVLARFLYTNDAICVNTAGVCDGSISEGIVAAFNPQTMIDRSAEAFRNATGQTEMNVSYYAIILILSIWASWKMFMMFFKVGTLFLGRIVQLWVHLVMSPIAFINMILPKKITAGEVKDGPVPWANEFFKNAFIAPLFMFFMYLIFLMLSKFDVATSAFATHGHSDFLVILIMVFPFFVITMLMDKAIEVTTKQAGNMANQVTSKINQVIGAVAGTALALGGGAIMGTAVKYGGAALGSLGKSMVSREGKGKGVVGRAFNSKLAKLGGRVNQYSKDLPNKNFDIRKSPIANQIRNATGFDLTTGQGDINKWLGRGGIRTGETNNQRNARKKKAMLEDIERRKISEKSGKSDRELKALAQKREKQMHDEMLKNDFTFGRKYDEAKKAALASGQPAPDLEKFKKDYLDQNYKAEMEAYKVKKAGSAAMFDAKSNDEYSKAAKEHNKEVKKAYIEKKKRDVYGGRTPEETNARFQNDQQAGIANTGDLAGAGGAATGLGLAASAVGVGTGVGLAAAVVLGS
ncbi:MAG: hypothetical protein KBB86_02855, partial [Candidatus Pacebacteria bacterium]|nr:hypothetical protein [Candidatus Paceibacterota bacterium]